MPKVGKKEFAYTDEGIKQAKEYGLKLADTNDIPLGKKDYTPVPSSLLQSILNK